MINNPNLVTANAERLSSSLFWQCNIEASPHSLPQQYLLHVWAHLQHISSDHLHWVYYDLAYKQPTKTSVSDVLRL